MNGGDANAVNKLLVACQYTRAFRQVQGQVHVLQIVLQVQDKISDMWLLYRAFLTLLDP